MKIEKAIGILTICAKGDPYHPAKDAIDAINLSIEALKRMKECRLADHMIAEDWLPGETTE